MKTKISRWGNSYALRLPKALMSDFHLQKDTVVTMSKVGLGKTSFIKIVPHPENQYDLATMLAGITDVNIHGAVDWGSDVGREQWAYVKPMTHKKK